MKTLVLAVALLVFASASAGAAGVSLTISDGKVTLNAENVTIRQILDEWARIGKTQIVNLDRVTSTPVTMKLDGVPEAQALDIILRSVPGYMAAPRSAPSRDASIYDRILIMASTTVVARPSAGSTFPTPSPNVTQLRGAPTNLEDSGMPQNDPAIAAAAAAGLVAVPAPSPMPIDPRNPPVPGFPSPMSPMSPMMPQPAGSPNGAPATRAPTNFWNAPAGTAQPSLAPPPPAPTAARPVTTIPPQQPDR
jgi:hypothetical protein